MEEHRFEEAQPTNSHIIWSLLYILWESSPITGLKQKSFVSESVGCKVWLERQNNVILKFQDSYKLEVTPAVELVLLRRID